jgi:hypothetical protein
VLKVEVALARSREMAVTDEDVFVRRTRLTTHDASVRLPANGERYTLIRITFGTTANVAGVVPSISPSASIGSGGLACSCTVRVRASAMLRCGTCVPL